MKKIISIIFLGLLFFSACKEDDKIICHECDGIGSEKLTIWVDSKYGPCNENDTTRPSCLMVQFAENYEDGKWEPFEQEICGFEFKPGYRYKLSVRRKKIDEQNDQPVYKYCLLEILATEETFL